MFLLFSIRTAGSIRDEERSSGSSSLLDGLAHVGEDGTVKVHRAGLLGVGSTNDLGA